MLRWDKTKTVAVNGSASVDRVTPDCFVRAARALGPEVLPAFESRSGAYHITTPSSTKPKYGNSPNSLLGTNTAFSSGRGPSGT